MGSMSEPAGERVESTYEEIRELPPDEQATLFERLRSERTRAYQEVRTRFGERLRQAGLLTESGLLVPEVSPGRVAQPAPGQEDEWAEYCREHPRDPVCLAGSSDALRQYLDLRSEYVDELAEQGLLDFERESVAGRAALPADPSPQPSVRGDPSPQPNVTGLPVGWAGYTPDPRDPDPWPWPWPGSGVGPRMQGDPIPFPASRYGPRY